MDVQFDWLCGIRRYVDVLPAFCSSVVSYSMVKESSDFVKKKNNNGGVELVVDHYSVSLLFVRESISMPSSFPGGKCRNASSLQSGHVFFIGNHCPYMQSS